MNLKMQKLFIIVIVNLSLTEAFKEYMRLISNMYNMSNRTSIDRVCLVQVCTIWEVGKASSQLVKSVGIITIAGTCAGG